MYIPSQSINLALECHNIINYIYNVYVTQEYKYKNHEKAIIILYMQAINIRIIHTQCYSYYTKLYIIMYCSIYVIHLDVLLYVYLYVYYYNYVYMYMYYYMCMCTCITICVYVHVLLCVYMYIYYYMCICTCITMCVYVHVLI